MEPKKGVAVSVEFLAAKEAASWLGVSKNFFRASVAPEIPWVDFARPGSRKRLPRYSLRSLQHWVEQRRVG